MLVFFKVADENWWIPPTASVTKEASSDDLTVVVRSSMEGDNNNVRVQDLGAHLKEGVVSVGPVTLHGVTPVIRIIADLYGDNCAGVKSPPHFIDHHRPEQLCR